MDPLTFLIYLFLPPFTNSFCYHSPYHSPPLQPTLRLIFLFSCTGPAYVVQLFLGTESALAYGQLIRGHIGIQQLSNANSCSVSGVILLLPSHLYAGTFCLTGSCLGLLHAVPVTVNLCVIAFLCLENNFLNVNNYPRLLQSLQALLCIDL